jgi:hypothetical protein
VCDMGGRGIKEREEKEISLKTFGGWRRWT